MKARIQSKFCLIIVVLFFTQCSNKDNLNKEEYLKYVIDESNGLKNRKTIGGINYTLQYLPSKFMVLTNEENIIVDSIVGKEEQYSELEYFKLTIEEEKKEEKSRFLFLKSPAEYNRLLQYANTQLNSAIELNVDKEKYNCVMSYAEVGYKVTPKIIFLMAFNKPKQINDFKVSFKDEIFGNGIINFLMQRKDLEKLRIIKII